MTEGKVPISVHLVVVGVSLPCSSSGQDKVIIWIVISVKPFKASVACKEYSTVLLSLGISKDKTAVMVRCPARLNVRLMPNPKGRGGRGNPPAAAHCDNHFSRSAGEMCSAHKLYVCQEPRVAVLTSQLTHLRPGGSGPAKPVNIKKSSAYRKCAGWQVKGHTHSWAVLVYGLTL